MNRKGRRKSRYKFKEIEHTIIQTNPETIIEPISPKKKKEKSKTLLNYLEHQLFEEITKRAQKNNPTNIQVPAAYRSKTHKTHTTKNAHAI